MCDDKMLAQMRGLQVKPEELHCKCTHKCWCAQLSYKHPADQPWDECKSPKEMLDEYGKDMDDDDRKYLTSLLSKTFVRS